VGLAHEGAPARRHNDSVGLHGPGRASPSQTLGPDNLAIAQKKLEGGAVIEKSNPGLVQAPAQKLHIVGPTEAAAIDLTAIVPSEGIAPLGKLP
jgi:hypothetical protein